MFEPNFASGQTINETTINSYRVLLERGSLIPSRNGDCLALNDFTYYLANPRSRHLCLEGRTSNIFQLIGETLWVLSGTNVVSGYLEKILPRAKQYSDDGETWRAGYGSRLFTGNQLPDVVEYFRRDGKMTRRAAISIFDPNLDTFTQLQKVYGQEDTKDFSCNNLLYFNVDHNNKFNLRVTNRSNDAVFGMGINMTEFSVIQEIVFEKVREIHPEIELGTLSIYSNNFHGYEFTINQVRDVVSSEQKPFEESEMELGVLCSIDELRELMMKFTTSLCGIHESPKQFIEQFVLENPGMISEDGLMRKYMEMTAHQFAGMNGHHDELDISSYPTDLISAIVNSKFRKFPIAGV